MRTMTRFIPLLAVAGLVLAGCAAAGGASPDAGSSGAPAATPVPSPVDLTPKQTPTPMPMTDGEGNEVVTGYATDVVQTVLETYTNVGDVRQVRGGVVTAQHVANDVRATGRTEFAFSVDWYGTSGPIWGTTTLTTADGAWTGPCAGGTMADGTLGTFSCWLAGSGPYEGWTYYQLNSPGGGVTATSEGIIFEGDAPER
ncbi:MAG TPA: hypothetical protein VFY23_01795 [Candidatus Limnocylindrales bacterium]|nr:hypothetical protein [Candidatus Limnocylindrales bacterium]